MSLSNGWHCLGCRASYDVPDDADGRPGWSFDAVINSRLREHVRGCEKEKQRLVGELAALGRRIDMLRDERESLRLWAVSCEALTYEESIGLKR